MGYVYHTQQPARLIRFVPGAEIQGLACDFDAAKNLLRINQDLYEPLDERTKTQIFRSTETMEATRRRK